MGNRVQGKKVAILVTDGFEQIEMTSPRDAIHAEGGQTHIVSLKGGQIQGFKHMERGDKFDVDATVDTARPEDYDAILIPGGLFNPDALRTNEKAVGFARKFFEQKKPVFAICHGPQVLISADVVQGREMTGYEAIQPDLRNAGANVRNEAVVVDEGLVTSRNPNDLPAFNAKVVEELYEGKHAGQMA